MPLQLELVRPFRRSEVFELGMFWSVRETALHLGHSAAMLNSTIALCRLLGVTRSKLLEPPFITVLVVQKGDSAQRHWKIRPVKA